MVFDVAAVRGQYVSLGQGWTYLNAHQAPQIPERVSQAVSRSFRLANCVATPEVGRGSHSRVSVAGRLQSEFLLDSARAAVADLVGVKPAQVILGPSVGVLYAVLAGAMASLLRRNASVVLSRLDDPALLTPFIDAAPHLRWAQPDLGTGALPSSQYFSLVDGSTRLVVLSAAQSHLGTVAPVPQIVRAVRAQSQAWVLVDATSFAAYRGVDVAEWGADIVAVDVGELGGPQVAALVVASEEILARIDALPALPVAPGLAGAVPAVVDHLAELVESGGTRRRRLEHSMRVLRGHLEALIDDAITMLDTMHPVHVIGVSGEAGDGGLGERIPRISFAVRGVPAETVYQRLVDNGILTTILPARELYLDMGVEDVGGAVTISLSPFSTRQDIEHLTRVVASLA